MIGTFPKLGKCAYGTSLLPQIRADFPMAAWHGNGAGHGAGWGGPKKGVGKGRPAAAPFGKGHVGAAAMENSDPEEQAYRAERRRQKRDLRERMMSVLIAVAESDKEPGRTKSDAADRVLDRIDGKPTANVNVQANVRRSVQDLSDEELAALASGGESEAGIDEEGGC